MFSAESQQVQICLLKSNLEEIENDLVSQWSAVPELEAQGNQKREETRRALQEYRAANAELERLKAENAHLSVKQVSLKRQLGDISRGSQAARASRDLLVRSVTQKESEIDQLIHSYEVSMAQKADRFRRTRGFYYEEEVNKEMDFTKSVIKQREAEFKNKQKQFEELKTQAEQIRPEVPEELLEICGRPELSKLVDDLQTEFEKLSANRDTFE